MNTWIPYEVHTSPHDLGRATDEPLFPVADTPHRPARLCNLLRLVVSGSDAPARRERRRGLWFGSRRMDPRACDWNAMAWLDLHDQSRPLPSKTPLRLRRRLLNRGASHEPLPAIFVAGRQLRVVDYDGRLLAGASPGSRRDELSSRLNSRYFRAATTLSRRGSSRICATEAYQSTRQHRYPPTIADDNAPLSYEK